MNYLILLLPEVEPAVACVVCGKARIECICERCAVVGFHDSCYWQRVATAAERLELETVEQDPATLIILCPGCRQ